MPDEIDRLVDAETEAELNAPKPSGIDVSDKALVESGSMTRAAARELTEQIKATATATYVLIHRAHEHKVWVPLGYDSWGDYVQSEFDMSKSRSYQLINQAKVIDAIEEVTPDGTSVTLTEAQARDVEKALPHITDRIRRETSGKSPEEASEVVRDVVNDSRQTSKKEKKERDPNSDGGHPDSGLKGKPDDSSRRSPKGVSPIAPDGIMEPDGNDEPLPDDDDDAGFDAFDETGASANSIQYIFAYFEGIGDPVETARIVDHPKDMLEAADKAIDWLGKFRDELSKKDTPSKK